LAGAWRLSIAHADCCDVFWSRASVGRRKVGSFFLTHEYEVTDAASMRVFGSLPLASGRKSLITCSLQARRCDVRQRARLQMLRTCSHGCLPFEVVSWEWHHGTPFANAGESKCGNARPQGEVSDRSLNRALQDHAKLSERPNEVAANCPRKQAKNDTRGARRPDLLKGVTRDAYFPAVRPSCPTRTDLRKHRPSFVQWTTQATGILGWEYDALPLSQQNKEKSNGEAGINSRTKF
jgi:hypothetical protein